ncbi:UDP-N-acetylglucosamine 4-epimerase [Mycovorax composti]|jgi:Nucleoside-diphosphate-sugar epimerases|uniref:UDP-N-acetylglucosamine 4-epimerase n=1 Tax=Mycovorax composti TaxID=2962693 RepID=A0ABZ2EKD8_9BACT
MNFSKYHSTVDINNSTFLVTGGAGFIGSHLVEYLVQYQAKRIVIFDNLSTGYKENISDFLSLSNVVFIEKDIRNYDAVMEAVQGVDYVLHQAALGSVPRSIKDPLTSNEVNVNGFLNVLNAAKEHQVQRMVYAASSSTYGDSPTLPKVEDKIGKPLSPYAVTKYVNELYAEVFSRVYNFHSIGLRYFNVFGPKQNINGPYAAVIPLFITQILNNVSPTINGDGETSRDFTFVSNVVQANIKALEASIEKSEVFNCACNERITLNQLVHEIKAYLNSDVEVVYGNERPGDVRHSQADITKAVQMLGYQPEVRFREGLLHTIDYFKNRLK